MATGEITPRAQRGLFGRTAENVGKYCRKGKQIYIEGRLQTRKWQDRDDTSRDSFPRRRVVLDRQWRIRRRRQAAAARWMESEQQFSEAACCSGPRSRRIRRWRLFFCWLILSKNPIHEEESNQGGWNFFWQRSSHHKKLSTQRTQDMRGWILQPTPTPTPTPTLTRTPTIRPTRWVEWWPYSDDEEIRVLRDSWAALRRQLPATPRSQECESTLEEPHESWRSDSFWISKSRAFSRQGMCVDFMISTEESTSIGSTLGGGLSSNSEPKWRSKTRGAGGDDKQANTEMANLWTGSM